MTETIINESLKVPLEFAFQRVDKVVVALLPQYSRARIQAWLKNGELLVNGKVVEPKQKVNFADRIDISASTIAEGEWAAEKIALSIIYEDEHLLVVDKAQNFVVHPAPGHRTGTLINAALYHCPRLRQLPRAGIVHRLDKDTTGLMVIAKTLEAHHSLVSQLQTRRVGRIYEAVVWGELDGAGQVDAAIARSRQNRQKMAVTEGGKPAITHYQVIKKYPGCTHLRLQLETGRTHQIRVHMAHLNHPLVGDATYGGRTGRVKMMSEAASIAVSTFSRQALHAVSLSLDHPLSGIKMRWQVELPADLRNLITTLDAG